MILLWQKHAMVNGVNHPLPWRLLHWVYQAGAEPSNGGRSRQDAA